MNSDESPCWAYCKVCEQLKCDLDDNNECFNCAANLSDRIEHLNKCLELPSPILKDADFSRMLRDNCVRIHEKIDDIIARQNQLGLRCTCDDTTTEAPCRAWTHTWGNL